MTDKRLYFSMRSGKDPEALKFSLSVLNRLLRHTYEEFYSRDYFQQSMGFTCVDMGYTPGSMGSDLEMYGLMKLKRTGLFPIEEGRQFTEEDIFDLIEFLHDHVSKPTKGDYHSWNDCGWHYTEFDKGAGQAEFRDHVNEYLPDYGEGWELQASGEIISKGDTGLGTLFEADVPHDDHKNINSRIELAIGKFRRYRSSMRERRDAVRDLADVLEFLRPQAKKVLVDSDESDLFNLANNFGIRHHNSKQKTHYDEPIWLSWMFYYYLATIHATVRLINRQSE